MSNADLGVYLKVPQGWTVYDQEAVQAREDARVTDPVDPRSQWVTAFDADPQPSLDHLFDDAADHPAGMVRSRVLSSDERQSYSLASLRDEVIRLSTVDASTIQVVATEDVERNGMRGASDLLTIRTGDSTFAYRQVALVDNATRVVHVLAIGCTAECYADYADAIDDVIASWTVTEPTAEEPA